MPFASHRVRSTSYPSVIGLIIVDISLDHPGRWLLLPCTAAERDSQPVLTELRPRSENLDGCRSKWEPWVPSTCVGDLRQLLRVPLRSQGHCGFGRGLSLLNWVWCNRRGPHLEWRQEPQGSSPYLTRVAGYLQSMDKRVTPRLLWRNGFPLAFRVVHGVTGHLLS